MHWEQWCLGIYDHLAYKKWKIIQKNAASIKGFFEAEILVFEEIINMPYYRLKID